MSASLRKQCKMEEVTVLKSDVKYLQTMKT